MSEIWRCFKTLKTSDLYFLYIFRAFKMTHFTLKNGPFCDVKRLILKKDEIFLPILFGFFTKKEWIGSLE